ncbi:TorF family putative porin [Pseudomonas aeruginosa]|uniref:TorF family putative porin n=1 Tax=Pseudomonas aeruginosa TaxID=287 RepID=UPI000B48986E|nr:TorF family putative porin [Pseudomonas aeruginosa]MCU9105310.1 TorF family putative porin [Pseudomonas aeruginosa]MCU9249786.1 TorF family putative porin [Pseudomonas aeruginosa]MCU9304549.1 TorF family putative porin [Pseudomonas aeruginosa]MCU9510342.1 TorF family putative porin [Pseudomonas aeruginosa]OWJ21440.1 hypothetical protein CDC03_26840 [Pseudomonas aeruginosa]
MPSTSRSLLTLSLLCVTMAPVHAMTLNDHFDLSLSAEVVSDYRSRGQSQTLGDPALQASATLSHSSGLYAGIWTSNVDFGFDVKTRQEIDYYAGYFWQIEDGISLDVGYAKYAYEKSGGLNYSEVYAIFSAYGVKLGHQYSDNFGTGQEDSYSWTYLGYETSLPMDSSLSLRYGQVDYKDDVLVSSSGKARSRYNEWEARISKELLNLKWSLAYIDTDRVSDRAGSEHDWRITPCSVLPSASLNSIGIPNS